MLKIPHAFRAAQQWQGCDIPLSLIYREGICHLAGKPM